MKISPYAIVIAMLLPLFIACDDNIDAIGASLNSDDELLDVTADTFDVTSRTVIAAPAIARSNIGYLGRMYDPETKTLITGNIMTQFHVLENYQLPDKTTCPLSSSSPVNCVRFCSMQPNPSKVWLCGSYISTAWVWPMPRFFS